jgi:voltage-dependent anion channel protein 2
LAKYTASYYHRVNDTLEVSAKAVRINKENAAALEMGVQLCLDRIAFVKGKINNAGVVGVAYTQAKYSGININMVASADMTHLNENAL